MVVMATIITIAWHSLIYRAERVACTGNLRVLHQAFSAYTLDVGSWPQEPLNLGSEGHQFYGWLVGELTPYGGPRIAWMCPTEVKAGAISEADREFVGSYVPTMFDSNPNRPWQWAGQPWLIERKDNHDSGRLIIMPDGSVFTDRDVLGH